MKQLLKVLYFGIIGSGIGFFAITVSLLIMKSESVSIREMIVWSIASFLMGVISMVMYCEKLKLLTATAIHFVLVFLTSTAANFICGYAPNVLAYWKEVFPSFILIYVIIYAIVFAVSKLQEKSVNNSLNKQMKK